MLQLLLVCLMGVSQVSASEQSLKDFRKSREESLKKNWLVITGLTWLKIGLNSVGSDPKSDVDLPTAAPKKLGQIVLTQKKATIMFDVVRTPQGVVMIDGQPAKGGQSYTLVPDSSPNKTVVSFNGIEFHLVDRPNGLGVRVKDPNADTLKNFKGLNWWPEQKNFIITGQWKELKPAKKLRVPDVLGNTNEEMIQGSVVFKLNGKDIELFPTRDKDDLFFVFKDATSGKESYGTGRFLYAKLEASGKVVMDFNRAYNPPCAYIKFATCPLPPAENKITEAIPAGEKTPPGH